MSSNLLQIIAATALISSGSLIGVLTITLSRAFLSKILLSLVSLSAGTMLGAAFLHLLPEAITSLGATPSMRLALFSFIVFFLLERFIHWRHCHDESHLTNHTLGTLNLLSDALHNFLDGALIAASFSVSPELGWISLLAIALHEIPQEIGDFGVLLHSGFTRRFALLANVAVSLTAVLGGIIGYFLGESFHSASSMLVPVAAGAFIYIASADLIPELKIGLSHRKIIANIIMFMAGILIMVLVKG